MNSLESAVEFHQQGNFSEAKKLYSEFLRHYPTHFDALHLSGMVAFETGHFYEAIEFYTKAMNINSNFAPLYSNFGNALKALQLFDKALGSYDKAVSIKPDYSEAFYNRGIALQEMNRFVEALASYDEAIKFDANFAEAFLNRGITLQKLDLSEDAISSFNRAIKINSNYVDAFNNLGISLNKANRFEDALESFDRALIIKPFDADVFYNRGVTFQNMKNYTAALLSYEKAIAIRADYADAVNNTGVLLKDLLRFEEALIYFDKAISIDPNLAEAFNNRGNALRELKRLDEALASYEKAITIKSCFAEAFNNCGVVLQEMHRFHEAIAPLDRAISIDPDNAAGYVNRGNLLKELKRFDEALANYDRAFLIKSDYEWLFGSWLNMRMQTAEWSQFDDFLSRFKSDLLNMKYVTTPFAVLGLLDDTRLQSIAARQWINRKSPRITPEIHFKIKARGEKVRLGFFSADFRTHPLSQLMAGIFESHDRTKFDLIAFSFGSAAKDEMRERIRRAFDQFIDVRFKDDREVAELARNLKVDIAIDLMGFTAGFRTGIFSHQCAPIQVNYLGYPGTMSAEYIDYIIADTTIVPEEMAHFYTEKMVYLPNSYYPNSYKIDQGDQILPQRNFIRSDLNLPDQSFVFCCFNNSYKILPEVFDSWMRIMKTVKESVLWLLDENDTSTNNLKREAANRGISPARLLFAKRMPLADHLARHRCADLFLDTLPYNAHTTASDALWAGLPVITRIGESVASRVAASLLGAVGLSELITTSAEEYEQLAIRLATHPDEMKALKKKLSDNKLSSKLFDTPLYVRGLESAYAAMYERYQAGLEPDHIYIRDEEQRVG